MLRYLSGDKCMDYCRIKKKKKALPEERALVKPEKDS
jgi:hypothetical protein